MKARTLVIIPIFIFIVIASFLFSSCDTTGNGGVDTLGIRDYRVVKVGSSTYEYDSNGNLIKVWRYTGNNSFWSSYSTYEYDSNGNIIQRTVRYKYSVWPLTDSYVYNSNGNLIGWWEAYLWEAFQRYYTYEYDSDGNLVKGWCYRRDVGPHIYDDIFDGYYNYEYDSNGNLIKRSFYDEDDTLGSYLTYEYDSDENLIKESVYDVDGTLNGYYTFEYDSNGNLIKRSMNGGTGYMIVEWEEGSSNIDWVIWFLGYYEPRVSTF